MRTTRRVSIQVAEGGWTVEVEYEPDKPKKGDDKCCGPTWEPTTPRVFTDKTAMLATIGKMLGNGASDEAA